MSVAFGHLGYTVTHGMGFIKDRKDESNQLLDNLVHNIMHGRPDPHIYNNYEYVGNLPILHWRVLAEDNPEIKFILTIRDEDEWWDRCVTRWSAIRHYRTRRMIHFRQIKHRQIFSFLVSAKCFGCYGMNERAWRTGFKSHNEEVINYFRGTDRLLVHNVFEGHGYTELCEFLGMELPLQNYPNTVSLRTQKHPKEFK